ncbi:hypothetical protein OH76DRAFT_1412001 [Lentinus brumalis]|uniref:Uncharacterized protein n=1 Tax=Lentinus brumalis TaxID=2498619 RepID=A0A371CMN5_9APHY|nr:hypothetical protein OH76DRAFT_1412001 [Polyporus brumalis]
MAKKKPSRRPFGRPKDGPGPQETFVGEFQVEQAQAPPSVGGSQHTIRLSPPAQIQAQYEVGLVPSSSVHRSNSAPERGRGRRDGVRRGERRPSIGALSVASSSSARVGHREATDDAPQAGPSGRRRPSLAGHRSTQSHPTVLAAGGYFPRSHSSTMLAGEMSPDGYMSAAMPSSWPRSVHPPVHPHTRPDPLLQPMSPVVYHGSDRQAPITPSFMLGQYPTPGLTPSNPLGTPSTNSLSLLSPPPFSHRPPPYEPHELSPIDPFSSWRQPSVPYTPSMRGGSIPPSVQSGSPYTESLFDFEYSPTVGPMGGPSDVPELPPLSPDPLADGGDLLWGQEGGVHAPSAETAYANYDPTLLGPAQYSPSRVAVPGQPQQTQYSELEDYSWPQGPADSTMPVFCWPQLDISDMSNTSHGQTEPYFGPSRSGYGYSVPPGGAPGHGHGPRSSG